MTISTFDEDVEVWKNPEDKYDVFTVSNIFEYHAMKTVLLKFLAGIEDGKEPDFEMLYEECEKLGISPEPCPLCGRYSEHPHEL